MAKMKSSLLPSAKDGFLVDFFRHSLLAGNSSFRDDKIIFKKKRRLKAKEIWGLLPDWKTPTQKLKDEARKGWESKTDRKK